ncbi:Branched-chain amino acid transport ATP-binding protein LivF [Desulfosporosinus sp. I2]|uniref:ABC transporter ATP-binding protein n=1 Tax=Desulfosporosinus sp. I2 TaxID=1617025 RepID=UPI0005EE8EE6|nr:ABC transporter ATP-binding protein [Desulfosporosinus sp. I2]KJR48185.1 Branched-chain amino acid transport ATP-binding protein LivF [Desulfosporosinus sp. I2]
MTKIMEVEDLEVVYGVIKALQGISFYIDEGEIVTIIGANGAGKSSTLRAISGMVRPSSGKVRFKNKDITNSPSHLIARQGLSHVPEGRGMLTKLTVEENLILATYNRKDHAKVKEDMEEVYKQFPRLSERKKQASGNLSGGEQQMLAIGRALMTGADTLLLDEPSMGLAPLIVKEIFEVIKRLNQAGKTILLVEQNAMTALNTAHRAYILENGAVLKSGLAADLISDPEVKAAYLGGH